MKKTIIALLSVVALVASCDLEKVPYNKVSSSAMANAANAEIATNGNYGLFKAHFSYRGMDNIGWTYIRHYQQLSELKSDNVLMSGKSTDPLFLDATLDDTAADNNIASFWFLAYKLCYSTSAVINVIDDATADQNLLQLKGENYFMRAVAHLHLSQLFSQPYSFGRDNLGVIRRTEAAAGEIKRSTVGEIYDLVEEDLKAAIKYMDGCTRRGNNGYASKEAAQAILSRLYLWEGRDQDCIDLVTEMLAGADPVSKLDPDIENLYQNAKNSPEVLWCVALTSIDDPNDFTGAQAMAGSMYYSLGDPGNGTGWAEIYYSQPLLDLYNRYPADQRLTKMLKQHGKSTTGKKMIYWPIESSTGDGSYDNYIDRKPTYDPVSGKYTVKDANGDSHVVETEIVNTYPKTYIMLGANKQYVTVADSMGCRTGTGGDVFPCNYMMKFSNQDGIPSNLASPIYARWGEVILNRAEAYAHLGNHDQDALNDVNAIRTRAGLTGDAQFTLTNYGPRGYASVLDVVLDERRMELCFEGFRVQDIQRNKKYLDRQYAGRQKYEIVNYDDPRLLYYIPETEINTSGVPQNR